MPTTTEEYAELANTINKDLGKVNGSPQRLAILLGIWGRKNGAIIPNKEDRSRYTMEKYKFLLDAQFNISDKCCNVMKKKPSRDYESITGRKPIIATMASESKLRTQKWLQQGCNSFDSKHQVSKPISFWTEQDVLYYIKINNITIASVYGEIIKDYDGTGNVEGQLDMSELDDSFGIFDIGRPVLKTTGCSRTGCMFCGYGCHLEKPGNGRFERMKQTHPKQYDYIMRSKEDGGLGYKEAIDWINENGNMNIRY